jgi:hypothetical protein
MIENNSAFQSRWGFHPCHYDVFLKLKRLHKWYWQAVYDFHRWNRWQRKLPHNRVGSEPSFCPLFVEESIWYKPVRTRGVNGFRVYPKTVVDRGIVSLYHQARTPQPQPVTPLDDATVRQIEELYAGAEACFRQ